MTHDDVKKQLTFMLDDIVNSIMNDKIVELKKEKNNVIAFDVIKKRFNNKNI